MLYGYTQHCQHVGGITYPLCRLTLSVVVPQYFQHACAALLGGEQLRRHLAVFVAIDQDMFRRRNKTMLNAAVSSEGFLICAGMKKAYVKRFFVVDHRQKHFP